MIRVRSKKKPVVKNYDDRSDILTHIFITPFFYSFQGTVSQPASTTTKIINFNANFSLPYKCSKCEILCFKTETLLQSHVLKCKGKSMNILGGQIQQRIMTNNIKEDNKQTMVSQNFQNSAIIREGSFFALMAKITPKAPQWARKFKKFQAQKTCEIK